MAPKHLTLFHAPCSQRIARIRLVPHGQWLDALVLVAQDLQRQRTRCPRCRLPLRLTELVPSLDDQTFAPVQRPDESGLVGFGPEQDAAPGQRR